jgi:hypothetical protein
MWSLSPIFRYYKFSLRAFSTILQIPNHFGCTILLLTQWSHSSLQNCVTWLDNFWKGVGNYLQFSCIRVYVGSSVLFTTALLCIVSILLVLCRFDVARLIPSLLSCSQSWLLLFLFAPKKSNAQWAGFCVCKVYQRQQFIRGFQNNMGTLFNHSGCLQIDWKIQ